jgi:hypothetical protein
VEGMRTGVTVVKEIVVSASDKSSDESTEEKLVEAVEMALENTFSHR